MRAIQKIIVLAVVLLWTHSSWAQSVELSVQTREIFSGVPFVLNVSAKGFEDAPTPEISDFQIDGASVEFQDVTPSIHSQTTNINGRITSSTTVFHNFRYVVVVPKAGNYEIPAITVRQGNAEASSTAGQFSVKDVEATDHMRISLEMPERAVWLGETFPVKIRWDLLKKPREQQFAIPLLQHSAFEVRAAEIANADTVEFGAGDSSLTLPYQASEFEEGSSTYTRFEFHALATPLKSGRFTLAGPQVVSKLQTGVGRDSFGFRTARYGLFKAIGEERTVEVKPLPLSGKPASFSGAVGSGFGISVEASRTVVAVGEPVELAVTIRGKQGLSGLGLPKLIGEGGLDSNKFDVLEGGESGQMSADGLAKSFRVTVVLTSPQVSEIPEIEFAYFDPEVAEYKIAKSEPIAINVRGGSQVGADDVISNRAMPGGQQRSPDTPESGGTAFSGDLSPSSAEETLRRVSSIAEMRPWIALLYVLPLLAYLGVWLWGRTSGSRNRSSELRELLKEVKRAARAAEEKAAKDGAGALIGALRELAQATGHDHKELVSRLEEVSYDPARNQKGIDRELLNRCVEEASQWSKGPARGRARTAGAAAFVLLSLGGAHNALSQDTQQSLAQARKLYETGLASQERGERLRAFQEAAALYEQVSETHSRHPELFADLGNAYLGAGELGRASLWYSRALQLDQKLSRARANRDWIRSQSPKHLVWKEERSALDSLFFWHRQWSLSTRHLVAGSCFALFILLIAPWQSNKRRILRRVALLPLFLWAATFASILLETEERHDAVVMREGMTLLSADSYGAPAAMRAPLPSGVEVKILQRRDEWTQVRLADQSVGWLPSEGVEPVRAEDPDTSHN